MSSVELKYMLPLWKSNYSLGKSILSLDAPEKSKYPNGAESIFKILKDEGLKDLVLLEDNPSSFFEAYKRSKQLDIKLMYGVSFGMKNSLEQEDGSDHKTAIFMLNDDGYRPLVNIFSVYNKKGSLDYKTLRGLWNENLLMAIPFYDSFLHKNLLENQSIVPEFDFCKPVFFKEDNQLPFDFLIRDAVDRYASSFEIHEAKSIFYRNRADIKAYLTYKIICNRGHGRQRVLSSPNFSHFSSAEFCWEAFKEKNLEK